MLLHDLIGVPFVDGGRDRKTGYDCWGLSCEVFRRYGIELPDFKVGCMEASRIDATIGRNRRFWRKCDPIDPPAPSLVVIRFNSPLCCNHTGVYIGGRRFIHARTKIGVNIDRIDSAAWRKMIEGFYVPIFED